VAGNIAPHCLLFAAAEGVLLGHRTADAGRWFSLCASPAAPWVERLAAIESARAHQGPESQGFARHPRPSGPPAALERPLIARLEGLAASSLARGRPRDALGSLELALATARSGAPAGLLIAAGELRGLLGHMAAAEQAFDEAAMADPRGPEDEVSLAIGRARIALEQDDAARAAATLLAALAGSPGGRRAEVLSLLGAAEAAQGRWAEGDEQQRASLTWWQEQQGGAEGAEVASSLHWLGLGQLSRGRLAEAEALLGRASELRGAALWPDHPDHAGSVVALSAALAARGRLAEAERGYREASGMLQRSLGAADPRTTLALSRLAELLLARRRWEEAEPIVLDLLGRAASAGHDEELGRWREASEQVRVGRTRGGAEAESREEPLAEAIGTAPLDDEGLLRRLATFAGYVVLVHRESGGLLTLTEHEGLASGALVFTGQAQADAFLAQAPAEVRGWFDPMTMDGHSLFQRLPGQQVDGLIFNCLGPWPRTAPLGLCAAALGCL
jgi:tetratricopeptide (TPR) repeat protein